MVSLDTIVRRIVFPTLTATLLTISAHEIKDIYLYQKTGKHTDCKGEEIPLIAAGTIIGCMGYVSLRNKRNYN